MPEQHYSKLELTFEPVLPAREVALAWLSTCGFDMFEESETGLTAFAKSQAVNRPALEEVMCDLAELAAVSVKEEMVPAQNWNATWERDYTPIDVDGKAMMRAPFHAPPEVGLDLIIKPQMSFGTGHHPTTWQMLHKLLQLKIKGVAVLDMGCGTGVLAIAAHKLGARRVVAVDIDAWSFENTQDNFKLNGLTGDEALNGIHLGDAQLLNQELEGFDVILANINRNVLVADIGMYNQVLVRGGHVVMSGFFEEDVEMLQEHARRYHWKLMDVESRRGWACTLWEKSDD